MKHLIILCALLTGCSSSENADYALALYQSTLQPEAVIWMCSESACTKLLSGTKEYNSASAAMAAHYKEVK